MNTIHVDIFAALWIAEFVIGLKSDGERGDGMWRRQLPCEGQDAPHMIFDMVCNHDKAC